MDTFTGSAEIGWDIRSRAGMKRTTLELGGNAAVIVHDDADVSRAAERCCAGAFAYAGQVCISVQRIFVQRKVFGSFCDRLVELTSKLKVGDPHDRATDVGPMLDDKNAERIEGWVDEARANGAQVLCGGQRKGRIYHPTVLTKVPKNLAICAREAFGPIVVVEQYEKFPDAIEMVNDSIYGLQAGVFTSDVRSVMQAFRDIEVGGVIANDVPTFRADNMPYGGVKASGLGREGVKFAIAEMLETKVLVLPE
jgi:glyceraldehyde-3-phosphate dehydrogenase (NADP+)